MSVGRSQKREENSMLAASVEGSRSGSASLATPALGAWASSRSKLLITVLLAALLTGVLGVAVYKREEIAELVSRGANVLGEGVRAAGQSPIAKSLAALLDQRSPGERTQAELTKDKQRNAAQPRQRALGKVRPALPTPFVQALTTPVPPVVPEAVPVASLNPLVPSIVPAAILPPPPVFIGGGGPGGGGGFPGGGGGPPGGGSPPNVPPGVEVPPVVSPVPEPATWLTMILGFYILARALRKQRPAKARGAALTA